MLLASESLEIINLNDHDFDQKVIANLTTKRCFILSGFSPEFLQAKEQFSSQFDEFLNNSTAKENAHSVDKNQVRGFHKDGSYALGSILGDILFFEHNEEGNLLDPTLYPKDLQNLEMIMTNEIKKCYQKILHSLESHLQFTHDYIEITKVHRYSEITTDKIIKLHQDRQLFLDENKNIVGFFPHKDIGNVTIAFYDFNNSSIFKGKFKNNEGKDYFGYINLKTILKDEVGALVLTGKELELCSQKKFKPLYHEVVIPPCETNVRKLISFFFLSKDYAKNASEKDKVKEKKAKDLAIIDDNVLQEVVKKYAR